MFYSKYVSCSLSDIKHTTEIFGFLLFYIRALKARQVPTELSEKDFCNAIRESSSTEEVFLIENRPSVVLMDPRPHKSHLLSKHKVAVL